MNSFLKKYCVAILLCLIISLGAFLRLSHFGDLARFNADQVRDAKIVDGMFEGIYPLLGPKAGGTEFHLGPAFYYLEYTSALLFGHDPAGIALFVPLLSIASIGLFFLFFRIIFSPALSLVLTLLYATSLYVTRYSRFAWNPNVIPFFLFAFLLLLLKIVKRDQKYLYAWYILTGLVMGIGMQLHTTLLLLMPFLFHSVHGYLAWKKRPLLYRGFFLAIVLALLLHAPFFLYDVNNQGANTLSFLQGTEKKTDKTTSLLHGTLANMEFFLQGNTYALVGVEPQKSWLRIPKLFASENTQEILLFLGGIAVFFFGLILGIRRFIQEKSEERRQSLLLVFLLTGSLFLLFLPIAEELNLRFFIVVIFLPFLFLGFMAEALLRTLRTLRPLGFFLIGLATCTLITTNLVSYQRIYTLDEKEPESAYGGISIGEATSLTTGMKEFGASVPGQTLFLAPFEFERSLDYFVQKSGLILKDFSPEDMTSDAILYHIVWNKKVNAQLEEYTCCYTLVQQQSFGRFTLLMLQQKKEE